MIEIFITDNIANIKTNDIEILIEGSFEIKKEGAKAPTIKVISKSQK